MKAEHLEEKRPLKSRFTIFKSTELDIHEQKVNLLIYKEK